MIDAMNAAAQVAPPVLAARIEQLADVWSATPERSPDQSSADLMMHLTNTAAAECPGIQDATGE